MITSPVLKPSVTSVASVDSLTIIEAAQVSGTVAVIKSPHLDRLTPRVSRRGFTEGWFHLAVIIKDKKKKVTKNMKKYHSQNW